MNSYRSSPRSMQRIAGTTMLLCTVVVFTGCWTNSVAHTARPVEAGHMELATGFDFNLWDTGTALGFLIGPMPMVSLRYGVNDMFDFGVRYSAPVTVGLDLNFSPIQTDFFALSLDPEVQLLIGGNLFLIQTYWNLLVDFDLGDAVTITLGFRPGYWGFTAATTDANFGFGASSFMLGGMGGLRFHLSKFAHLALQASVVAPVGNPGPIVLLPSIHAGVAFQF